MIIEVIYTIGSIYLGCSSALLGLAFPFFVVAFISRRYEVWWIRRDFPHGPRIKPAPSVWLLLLYILVLMSDCRAVECFLKFQRKTKQSEAKTNLGAIFVSQTAYFGERNTYAGGPDAFELLNWAPENKTLYAYYCGDDFITNSVGDSVTISTSDRWPFTSLLESSDTGFTCLAVGNIDYDGQPDVWSINDAKMIENIYSDLGTPAEQTGPPIYIFPEHPVLYRLDSAASAFWEFYRPGMALMVSIFGSIALVWLTWREEKGFRADMRRAGVAEE